MKFSKFLLLGLMFISISQTYLLSQSSPEEEEEDKEPQVCLMECH